MTQPTRTDIHELLGEQEWLAGLARRLFGDGPDADDLAQETLSRALQHGVVPKRPRQWLGSCWSNSESATTPNNALEPGYWHVPRQRPHTVASPHTPR